MAKLPQGTTEYLRVDITDRTGELNSILGTSPTYDVKNQAGTSMYDNAVAIALDVVDEDTGNTTFVVKCMIDTDTTGPTSTLWPGGEYRLYIDFITTPELPRLGPFPFTVDAS